MRLRGSLTKTVKLYCHNPPSYPFYLLKNHSPQPDKFHNPSKPKNCVCASVASLLLINSRRHMSPREVYRKLMRKMRTDAIVIKSPNNKNNNGPFSPLFENH